MNTNRIKIINQDRSQSSTPTVASITGYTVVKAEKGPIKPVFIAPGNLNMVYELLGYTSKDFSTMQDVIDFNTSYGLWVSAPYDEAAANKTPVAYISPAGIFSRTAPVDITGSRLEDIELEEASVDHISSISADEAVLVPVGLEGNLFNASVNDVADSITYTAGISNKVDFNFGFDLGVLHGELEDTTATALHFLNTSAFAADEKGRVLRNASGVAAVMVVDIPGAPAPLELYIVALTENRFAIRDNAGHDIIPVLAANVDGAFLSITIDSTSVRSVILPEAYSAYFSALAVNVLWSSSTFRAGVKVYWKATLNKDAIYGAIYQKYLSARTTTLTFPKQTMSNKITFTAAEKSTPTSYSSFSTTGSLLEEDVDGFGGAIGFKLKLADQAIVNVHTFKPFDSNTIFTATGTTVGKTFTPAQVVLSRGVRTLTDASLELGWSEALDPEMDAVEVFFNPIPLTNTATLFTTLAGTQKLSRFIGARTVEPSAATVSLPELAYGANYFITTNLFTRKSGYTREDFNTPLVGAYAEMIARCIDYKLGGIAPMFLNSGGLGGQLNVAVKKPVYKYTKDQLTVLDDAGYNPIIRDPAYGVMVVGQKTAKGGELSDWSYVGHVSAFLRFQRVVRDQVMLPQIGKANNPYYQELRAEQVKNFLRTRTDGPGRIWASGTVDTVSANTDAVKAARQFAINVEVKVDVFSESVVLYFTNLAQTTEIGAQ